MGAVVAGNYLTFRHDRPKYCLWAGSVDLKDVQAAAEIANAHLPLPVQFSSTPASHRELTMGNGK